MTNTDGASEVIRPSRWLTLICVVAVLVPLGTAAIKGGLWILGFDGSSGVPLPLFGYAFIAGGLGLILYGLFIVLRAWRTCLVLSSNGMIVTTWTGKQRSFNWAAEGPFQLSCDNHGVLLTGTNGEVIHVPAINMLPEELAERLKDRMPNSRTGDGTMARVPGDEPALESSKIPPERVPIFIIGAVLIVFVVCALVNSLFGQSLEDEPGVPVTHIQRTEGWSAFFLDHAKVKVVVLVVLIGGLGSLLKRQPQSQPPI